jgi:hypothetical protein
LDRLWCRWVVCKILSEPIDAAYYVLPCVFFFTRV